MPVGSRLPVCYSTDLWIWGHDSLLNEKHLSALPVVCMTGSHCCTMDASSSLFGSMPLFGQASHDFQTNVQHMQHAQQFASMNPTNLQAQRQAQYRQEVVMRHPQALGAGQASQPWQAPSMQMPEQLPTQPGPLQAPAVPPSVGPMSSSALVGTEAMASTHHGRVEQGPTRTPWFTPAQTRAQTPTG